MVANNRSKPASVQAKCWVLHANAQWSHEHLECSPSEVAEQLLASFAEATGTDLPAPCFVKAHRWRFSRPCGQSGRMIWNAKLRLGACGDGCTEPSVEGAWLPCIRLCRPGARQLDGWTTPRSDHGCRECGVGCRAKDRVSRDGCDESSILTKPSVPGDLFRHVRVPLACLLWALRQDEQQRFIAGNSHLPRQAAPETNRR